MASQLRTCRTCGQPVTPGTTGVVRAVELVHEQDFGGEPSELVEGDEVFFHDSHVPADTGRYRVKSGGG